MKKSPLFSRNRSQARNVRLRIRTAAVPRPSNLSEAYEVIGPKDDRCPVNPPFHSPWDAMVFITGRVGGVMISGTGFFVTQRVMLTAGHVFLSGIGEKTSDVRLHFADEGFPPETSGLPVPNGALTVHPRWKNGREAAWDVGAIIFDQPFAQATIPLLSATDTALSGLAADVGGFPSKKPDGTPGEGSLWVAWGRMWADANGLQIRHTIDTTAGESGGPVITGSDDPALPYVCVGIHNYGNGSAGENYATRVTDELRESINDFVRVF